VQAVAQSPKGNETSKEQTDMNKKFVLALMLASGMALAQSSGSSPGSTDPQQPSTQPPSAQTQPGSQSPTGAGQSSLTGCLKGSDGSWILVAEGQSTPITGDSSTLSPHNGHQVQVKGSQASDGSFQVTEVVMIAETCTKQDASASSGMGAAAGAATGAATGAASDASQATKSAASDTASAAQSATAPKTYSDQNPSQSSTQSAGQSSSPTASQSASAGQTSTPKMPQTASPLPLLGLLGLGSLVSGLIARRK
jgi:hypothetical protein